MEGRDKGDQLVENDFTDDEKPKTNKKEAKGAKADPKA